jgi:hypothetical protein
VTRKTAAQYMRDHKDDFIAFLPSVGGEDTAGATDDGMMTDEGFSKYCRMVAETGEWGGEPEVSHFIHTIAISREEWQLTPRSKHYQERSKSPFTSFRGVHQRLSRMEVRMIRLEES